jgi:2-polyprenyl-3-methyl-5-hydroxy-6-metoxy-1,4-benzoquinol methylase
MNPYIKLPRVQVLQGRHELVLSKCRGRRVLHLGCVDSGLVEERLGRGQLMHQNLYAITKEIWGVDIDDDGISYLKGQGFDNLIVGDICELDKIEILKNKSFDVILASEVIEHLQNPGVFLKSVKDLMKPQETELIVTVPNAFRIDTLIWLLRGIEFVHPDHNYWFSYHTATNLLRKNDFKILEVYVYSFQPLKIMPNRFYKNDKKQKRVDNKDSNLSHRHFPSSPLELISAYIKSLPRRLIVPFLYKISPFWGDGIIIVTEISK